MSLSSLWNGLFRSVGYSTPPPPPTHNVTVLKIDTNGNIDDIVIDDINNDLQQQCQDLLDTQQPLIVYPLSENKKGYSSSNVFVLLVQDECVGKVKHDIASALVNENVYGSFFFSQWNLDAKTFVSVTKATWKDLITSIPQQIEPPKSPKTPSVMEVKEHNNMPTLLNTKHMKNTTEKPDNNNSNHTTTTKNSVSYFAVPTTTPPLTDTFKEKTVLDLPNHLIAPKRKQTSGFEYTNTKKKKSKVRRSTRLAGKPKKNKKWNNY